MKPYLHNKVTNGLEKGFKLSKLLRKGLGGAEPAQRKATGC